MRRARWVLVGCLALGCEGALGDDPAAHGEVEFAAASGAFSVRYLAPPWQIVTDEEQELELEIPPEVFGVALQGSPPTHVFRIHYADAPRGLDGLVGAPPADRDDETDVPEHLRDVDFGDPAAVALSELNFLIDAEDAQLDRELAEFVSGTGAQGFVFSVIVAPGLYVRGFYFDAAPTVVRAMFVSLFDLHTSDVELMARSVETSR